MNIELLKPVLTVVHVLGAVIGAGGALYSDVIFFKALKDKRVDKMELSILRTISVLVWCGLIALILSGTALFFTDPARYMASSKFVAKMAIVLVVTINGVLFHAVHIPFLKRRARMHKELFTDAPKAEDVRLVLSGIVSMVSWVFALVLGSLQSVPWTATEVLAVYVLAIVFGAVSSTIVMKRLLSARARINLYLAGVVGTVCSLILLFI